MNLWRRDLVGPVALGIVLVVGMAIFLTKVFGSATAQTIAAMTSAIIGGAAAVAAFLVVFEMRQDRRERNQPMVYVELAFTNEGVTWLTVKNIGLGVASNVSCAFEPVPVDFAGKRVTDWTLFQAPISTMLPGTEHRQIFMAPDYFQKDEALTPRQFTCFVQYQDGGGTQHSHEYAFDLERFRKMTIPRPTVAESLAELVKIVRDRSM